MPIRVSNLRLNIAAPEVELPEHLTRLLGIRQEDLRRWRILRKSLDARDKDALQFVYSLEAVLGEEEPRLLARARKHLPPAVRAEPFQEPPFEMPAPGREPLTQRPVVIGSGPAGLVAACFLAEQG